MHLGGSNMKNGNDILKEKAIEVNELENISGGGFLPKFILCYWVDVKICMDSKCKTADSKITGCKTACCHPEAVDILRFQHAYINDDLCHHCFDCTAMDGCPHDAIKGKLT
jgi:hypothetical protein